MPKEGCPKCSFVGSLVATKTAPNFIWTRRQCSCGVVYDYENGWLVDYQLPEGYKGRKVEAEAIVEIKMKGP